MLSGAKHLVFSVTRPSGRSKKSERESADSGIADISPVELGEKSLHDQSKIHGVIVDVGLRSNKSCLSRFCTHSLDARDFSVLILQQGRAGRAGRQKERIR